MNHPGKSHGLNQITPVFQLHIFIEIGNCPARRRHEVLAFHLRHGIDDAVIGDAVGAHL